MILSPADIAACNPAYWACLYSIKLQGGVFSFADHQYELEPMQSQAQRLCYMKATQMGITEIEVLKTLHGLIHRLYPLGVLYLFPTTDNVQEFSKSRFGPLIAANWETIGRYVKTGGEGTDTASLKKIRDAFLYLRGASLSRSVGPGDEKESVQLRSIPVDKVVFDELDLMGEGVISKARGRMGASKVQQEVYLSNPTGPDRGIAKVFAASDQRHWFRRCGCGQWTCAEESFPDCVRLRPDGTGYIACSKCGKELPPLAGMADSDGGWSRHAEWVPKKPENSAYMHGYRISQLMSRTIDPADILKEFADPPEGNIGDVYRLRLGLPYVAREDQLRVGDVADCCGPDYMAASSTGPCAMGVDIGKTFHVLIGLRIARDRYEIIRMARLPLTSGWSDLHDLAKRYNVRSAVVDIRPYEDGARAFQRQEPYRVLLCEYSENALVGNAVDDAKRIVKCYRTGICDTTHGLITGRKIVLPRRCPEVDVFIEQACDMAKGLETQKKTGVQVYRYSGTGNDHYRHALNYFYLAASGGHIVSAGRPPRRQEYAISDLDF
jgi:hypothetical protein